jgi:hypothetical protein
LSARHIHDEGDQAAEGKIDPFDWIPRPHQHGVPFKLNEAEMTHKQIEVYWRQRSQQSIANSGPLLHHGNTPSQTEARLAAEFLVAAGLHADKQTAPD